MTACRSVGAAAHGPRPVGDQQGQAVQGQVGVDEGVLVLTERGEAEVGKLVAAWKAWLMHELRGWLEAHEVNSEQRQQVEAAIGRITLRLVREADVEARRPGLPRATAAAAQ